MTPEKIAIIKAISVKRIDSPKNCLTSCDLSAPTTFRKPTSFALFSSRAVDRFMKLMQAIVKIKTAIIACHTFLHRIVRKTITEIVTLCTACKADWLSCYVHITVWAVSTRQRKLLY